MTSKEPSWLRQARKYIGLKEGKGLTQNPDILRWWKLNELKYQDDETAWCADFVGGMLEESGIHSTHSRKARSYLNFGTRLTGPALGCIVIFWREKKEGTKGHVGFIVGKTKKGNLLVLGGNQQNSVNIMAFNPDRVLGYVWPNKKKPMKSRYTLPVLPYKGPISTNEV